MDATFKIGEVEFISYLREGGIKWSRNDLDSEESGRTLDGTMHRSRIAQKRKLSVNMKKLTLSELTAVTAALQPDFVDVTYVDPELGSVTKTFYGSSVDATTQKFRNGEVYWENTSFSLIER